MRVRKLTAVAVAGAALALSALTGCDTKVGQAAIVDGHRITESQVAKYLTATAAAVPVQSQAGATTTIAPRAYVLNTLIDQRLYDRLLTSTKAGRPSEGDIAKATEQALAGVSVQQATEQSKILGYTAAFDRLWVRVQILGQVLQKDVAQGEDVRALLAKLHFAVTVNPRYGSWDAKILALSDGGAAGVPDFLRLVSPGPGTTASSPAN